MKAIRVHEVGDPEVMRLEEVPDLQPGAGQVVVRVIRTSDQDCIPGSPPCPIPPAMMQAASWN
jgi:hypothetical protein